MSEVEGTLREGIDALRVKSEQSIGKGDRVKLSQTEQQARKAKVKGGARGNDSPVTQLSKALSYILRHGTAKEGLKVRADGYVPLDAVLKRPKVAKIIMDAGEAPCEADILGVVEGNDKKRFELKKDEQDGTLLIRAVQGHSIGQVTELDHTELTLDNLYILAEGAGQRSDRPASAATGVLPERVEILHGTSRDAWSKILQSGGLSRMKRNHIHLAKGRPGSSSVISGMRASSPLIIHIDLVQAIRDGITFQLASNGAVLTSGQGQSGVLPLTYLTKVEDSKNGEVVWTRSCIASST